ncbi:MAG: hypothetical protein LBU82_08685 [Treponema sp.]|jgi:hypothetical protein|nr:hypothetical protein [Treponema sp.]
MDAQKRILIVTDESKTVLSVALAITKELPDCKMVLCSGESFAGTDLLPAEAFFIGCEKPHPASFAYLEDMLAHVNLAGRKCGVFSANEKALKYLCDLVKDCEAEAGEPLLIQENAVIKPDLNKWLEKVLG